MRCLNFARAIATYSIASDRIQPNKAANSLVQLYVFARYTTWMVIVHRLLATSLGRNSAVSRLQLRASSNLVVRQAHSQTQASREQNKRRADPVPRSPKEPSSNVPNPFAFAAIAVIAFAAFAFTVKKRAGTEKTEEEKRIHHPNPLIPVRQETQTSRTQ